MGCLIALEGIDGSGKGTQTTLLVDHLRGQGLSVAVWSFPQYQQNSFGRLIARFLNGEFGALSEVSPWLVALLFAGDRQESRTALVADLASHDVVVCDRYVASNVAHQSAKLPAEERAQFEPWVEWLEYDLHALPRPDRVLLLAQSAEEAGRWIAKKATRSYTDRAADLQEADGSYLGQVAGVYHRLAEQNAQWRIIPCLDATGARSLDSIAADIRAHLSDVLPPGPRAATATGPVRFADLAASRRAWIDQTLQPWCRAASRAELIQAEAEWVNVAGNVPTSRTLWNWAWSRFEGLTHPDLGVEETYPVTVTLRDGVTATGYPNARESTAGQLVLLGSSDPTTGQLLGPFSIDDVREVRRHLA